MMLNFQEDLSKIQRGLRTLSNLIPLKKQAILTPAQPYGPDIETFRDPSHALFSWGNKQTQVWRCYGELKTNLGRSFHYEIGFRLRKTQNDNVGLIPTRFVRPEIFSVYFTLSDALNAKPSQTYRYWQKGGMLSLAKGVASEDRVHLEQSGCYLKRDALGAFQLYASGGNQSICLTLVPGKPFSYPNQKGFFQKGDSENESSYFCAFSQMHSKGEIVIDGNIHDVKGTSSLEHEKMTAPNQNSKEDEIRVFLPSNEEIFIHLFYDEQNRINTYSNATVYSRDGALKHVIASEIRVENVKYWKSLKSSSRYPVRKKIIIETLGLELDLKPFTEGQEMDLSRTILETFWNGPIHVDAKKYHSQSAGFGFMKLSGYENSKSITKRLKNLNDSVRL